MHFIVGNTYLCTPNNESFKHYLIWCIFPDEPSKPNNVEVVDWDKDHADLKWTKPENDGGAPITGYIIEFKVNHLFYFKLY